MQYRLAIDIPPVYKRSKWFPIIGAAHGFDLPQAFGGSELRDYIIRYIHFPRFTLFHTFAYDGFRFTANLDPNGPPGMGIHWPRYDTQNKLSLLFQDSELEWDQLRIVKDDYREGPLDFITNLSLRYPN